MLQDTLELVVRGVTDNRYPGHRPPVGSAGEFRLTAFTVPRTARYVVETLGRRGVLELDGRREDRPTTGTLTLSGATAAATKVFRLANGRAAPTSSVPTSPEPSTG